MHSYDAIGKFRVELPAQIPGKHLWIMAGVWRVTPPFGGQQVLLDMENLISLDGPGCFWCEEHWTPALAQQPCKGQ